MGREEEEGPATVWATHSLNGCAPDNTRTPCGSLSSSSSQFSSPAQVQPGGTSRVFVLLPPPLDLLLLTPSGSNRGWTTSAPPRHARGVSATSSARSTTRRADPTLLMIGGEGPA